MLSGRRPSMVSAAQPTPMTSKRSRGRVGICVVSAVQTATGSGTRVPGAALQATTDFKDCGRPLEAPTWEVPRCAVIRRSYSRQLGSLIHLHQGDAGRAIDP